MSGKKNKRENCGGRKLKVWTPSPFFLCFFSEDTSHRISFHHLWAKQPGRSTRDTVTAVLLVSLQNGPFVLLPFHLCRSSSSCSSTAAVCLFCPLSHCFSPPSFPVPGCSAAAISFTNPAFDLWFGRLPGRGGGLCGFRVGVCVCVCQAVYVGQWWGCRGGEFTISPPQPGLLSSKLISREKHLDDNDAAAAAASFAFTLSGSAAQWFKYVSPASHSQLRSAPLSWTWPTFFCLTCQIHWFQPGKSVLPPSWVPLLETFQWKSVDMIKLNCLFLCPETKSIMNGQLRCCECFRFPSVDELCFLFFFTIN